MRTLIAVLCLLPFAAQASEEPLQITANAPMAVAGTGLTLRLIALTDQRCPADAECYWEGMVRAEILVTNGDRIPVIITLCNLCDGARGDAIVDGHTITLGKLSPSMEELANLGRLAQLADYRLAISVSP